MIIPKTVRYIHLLTYQGHHVTARSKACEDIMIGLLIFLTIHYPTSIVTILRGIPFDSLVQMSQAPLVICSASTFCFWPGLMNKNRVYTPLTWLFTGEKPRYLTDSWHWIEYPKLIQFGHHFEGFNETYLEENKMTRREVILNSLIDIKPN